MHISGLKIAGRNAKHPELTESSMRPDADSEGMLGKKGASLLQQSTLVFWSAEFLGRHCGPARCAAKTSRQAMHRDALCLKLAWRLCGCSLPVERQAVLHLARGSGEQLSLIAARALDLLGGSSSIC